MLRNAIWIMFFGLIVAGCASDRKVETMDSTGGTSSTPAVSSPSGTAATESTATSPKMSTAPATESKSMAQSKSETRIAAGVEEETLDTCLGRIPKDATAGQKMLAEQTCRRDFPGRR
jgi:hypothetical protein